MGIFDFLNAPPAATTGGLLSGATPPGFANFRTNLTSFAQQNPAFLSNLAASIGSAPNMRLGLAQAAAGYPAAQQADTARNQGLAQQKALADYLANPEAAKAFTPAQLQFLKTLPPDVAAKYVGGAIIPSSASGGPKTSLVPIWGKDANGNTVLIQPTDTGTAVQTKLPEGFTPSKGVDKIDAGTEWLLYDQQTGALVGRQPKNVEEAARLQASGTAAGTLEGTAYASLAPAIEGSKATFDQIDALAKNPGLGGITGGPFGIPLNQFKPDIAMSPDEVKARTQYDQLKGKAFLEARQLLKGGGQITDFEGKRAEAAMSRMDRALSKEDFLGALAEFKDALQTGILKIKAAASASKKVPTVGGGGGPDPNDPLGLF